MAAAARGLFITVEGGDGAGKSTQIKALAEYLEGRGRTVTLTREPGGCDNAETLRRVLLSQPETPWQSWTEAFLIAGARREHVAGLIGPKLAAGETVVCDRYSDSTLAYQGYGRGLPLADLQLIVDQAEQGTRPDLVIILDIDPTLAASRLAARGEDVSVFESQGADFQARVRQGYLDLAHDDPARYAVIDASQASQQVTAAITARVDELLQTRG